MQPFSELLEANPVIAAVKDEESLARCCSMEDLGLVFILYGNICTIPDITRRLVEAGKVPVVHLDLMGGLAGREVAVEYIRRNTSAAGVISTKPQLLTAAKKQGLYSILRVFLLDSMACENLERQVRAAHPDSVEILPGLMPKVIRRLHAKTRVPLIAGGLIQEREDVTAALDAGAMAVSSTNPLVWKM